MNELGKAYAGKMKCEVRKHSEGDSPDLIKKYGLDRHGMVIVDAAGKKLWCESGHNQTKAGVEKAIQEIVGS